MIKGFLTVGIWTLLSRILGFARDILFAAYLGAGPVAEAFVVAFSLPNIFRRFFAEGAFNMAFIPMFSKRLERGDDAFGFAAQALTWLALCLLGLTLVAQVFMPGLVLAMASGFADDDRLGIATGYGRITFVYILLISLAALFSGVLNALGRFGAAAAAPVLLNIILCSLILFAGKTGRDVGLYMSIGVPIAGAAQLTLVWWAASRAGYGLRLTRPRLSPEMGQLLRLALPAALAGGVVQINLLVGRQVASHTEGALQYLNLADRLYQLPLGVVAIAIGVVLLPELSRRLAAKDEAGGRDGFNRALEFALLLTLPAAVGLLVIPGALVDVLFQRGAFTPSDSAATAMAVAIYGLGLPAFVMQKVYQPLYFAREDTKTPFRFALWAMGINLVLALSLRPSIGYLAAPVATTISAWAMLAQLGFGARQFGVASTLDARIKRRIVPILGCSALMGGVVWTAAWVAAPALATPGLRGLALAGIMVLSFVTYFGATHVTGALPLGELKRQLRRRVR